ncbi:MAG: hypothetical protein K8I30_01515, partial [Anaerolineae bacterium]|nr:hypothetical protein [Anaerolineae bacterium]
TIERIMHKSELVRPRMVIAYNSLVRWTNWWINHRDSDGDGLPHYHHGNDSGWDNATVFAGGVPVESPDLAAFLIVQYDTLYEIARRLGQPVEDRNQWKAQADALQQRMMDAFWRGDHFVARHALTHEDIETDCLLMYMPLVLGKRLPQEVRDALIAGLKAPGRFLTDYGFATEAINSPYYEPDGYWRGPIWAPSTMLLVQGLRWSSEKAFADEISRRFCNMCAAHGMAENYDALSGVGLRDRAYTWTSSVFLMLANKLLRG